jgi:PPM family protein phosphatase
MMIESGKPGIASPGEVNPLAESLEEQVELLEGSLTVIPLAPGEMLCPEDEEPFQIIRLLRDNNRLRLYEVAQNPEGPSLWLWERAGEGALALEREAALLKEAQCPMFPRVQAYFTLNERSYLATEKCEGKTLSELLADGTLDPARAVSILSQVAFALGRLHATGHVHLGLRPGIIVPGKPTKILDLADVSRVGERPSRTFYHAGYSPPELLKNEPVDGRADIYSLGALLFHAVGGRPIAETGVELMAWEPDTPVAGIPQLLNRCLGDKETRYSTAEELHRDLIRLVRRLSPQVRYEVVGATSIGLEPTRTTNQDAFTYCVGRTSSEEEARSWAVACVADGMGGMEAGEAASDAVVRSIEAQAPTALASRSLASQEAQVAEVRKWIHEANERVLAVLESRRAKGGSTAICACLVGSRLTLSHVGDCRAYLIRQNEITLLTRDHSLAMALALQGEIDLSEVRKHPERSKVTRSLGDRRPMPDYYVDTLEQGTGKPAMEILPGDTVFLCSDGVWEPLSESEILAILAEHSQSLDGAAQAIVEAALRTGGADNATVVLVRVAT